MPKERVKVVSNILIAVVLSAIPIFLHYISFTPDKTGIGFDVLIYEPFDFAYLLLAVGVFVSVNIYHAKSVQGGLFSAVIESSILAVIWFVISVVALMQFHVSLGGTL